MRVTIASTTIPDWNDTRACQLWIWAEEPYMADDDGTSVFVQSASPRNGNRVAVRKITLTVNTVAKTLTIPDIEDLYSTTDSANAYARLNASFFTPQGAEIKQGGFQTFQSFRLQATASQTWENVFDYNLNRVPLRDDSAYSKDQSDRRYLTADGVQTLTNKTLTSPVINVGSDATGDVYYRNGSGAFTRLGIGSAAQVLTVSGGIPSWQTATGLTDPMSARGDLIYRNAANATVRLPVGAANRYLGSDGTDASWGQVSLSAGVTGTLPIGSGGTGSATQNFVDLSTGQTVAGNKNLTGITQFQTAPSNDTAWSSTGSSPLLFGGSHSTTAVTPTVTIQRTQTGGGTLNVGIHAFNLGFTSSGNIGDGYALSVLYRANEDASALANGDRFLHGIMSHVVMNQSNIVTNKNFYGYNLFKSEALVADVTYVANQSEAINNSNTDAPNRATTVFSGIAVNAAGGGVKMNSVAYMIEATPNSGATSFGVGLWPKRNSVRENILDFSAGGLYDVTGSVTLTQGSANVTGSGTKFTKEFTIGDQITDDGVNWYEVAATPVSDTAMTLVSNFLEATVTTSTLTKTVIPLKMIAGSYIVATDTINTYRVIGMSPANRVRIDNDGRTVFVGSGSGTQVTDSAGKVLSAALNTVQPGVGGTGLTSYAVGDLIYASGATTLSKLADVAVGSVLVSGGITTAPAWSSSPSLTTSLTVPVIAGGTVAGSTLTLNGTSNGSPSAADILLNSAYASEAAGAVRIGSTGGGNFRLTVASTSVNAVRVVSTAATATTAGAGIFAGQSTYPSAADHRLGFYTFHASATLDGAIVNGAGIFGYSGAAWVSGGSPENSTYMTFETTPTGVSPTRAERMRITPSGRILMGTTSDNAADQLQVAGGLLVTGTIKAGSGPTTLTDATGKILSASLNTVAVGQGGSGATTLTGLLQGNGTSAFTAITNSTTVGQVLRVTGSNAYGWGALDLADADAITGTLPVGNGGTGSTTSTGSGSVVLATSPTITTPTISGNLTQTGLARRFIADMDDATISNRFAFQTVNANRPTIVATIPNGTSTTSAFRCFNAANADAAAFASISATSANIQMTSSVTGAASLLPFQFVMSSTVTMEISILNSVVVGNAALATNATDGFLYIPTCAGTPTGTPTVFTGRVPMIYDTTNQKFWINSGGTWRGVVLT